MVNKWIPYPRYIFRKEIALSLIRKYIPQKGSFLEIGCASGNFGITLSQMGYKGHLIDFSPQAINYLKNSFEGNTESLTFEQADFEEFRTDAKFDLIILFEVLEHIENDTAVLEKICGLLTDNGFLLCSVPARKKLWASSDEFAGHKRRYEKKEIANLLDKNSFSIRKFYSYGFPWLNVIKIFRDMVATKQMKILSNKTETELTQQSGMNPLKIKMPFFKLVMNRYFWYIFIKFSLLFNDLDLAEGYLILANKK